MVGRETKYKTEETKFWEGRGKKLGRLYQRVKCNEANKTQGSLSQEYPILDRIENRVKSTTEYVKSKS